MSLLVCGINHKTSPIHLREKVVYNQAALDKPLIELKQALNLNEAAILSTCNRTEIYADSHDHQALLKWWSAKHHLDIELLQKHVYLHTDEAAVRHIIRVACGLDSMLLGEAQILGQMKQAYQAAHQIGTLGPYLTRLFQYVFSVTKAVRHHTGIGCSPVSIAYAAITLSKRIFADLKQTHVMLIGAGETIELAARYFRDQQVKTIFVVNRTFARAEILANKYQAKALSFNELANYLAQIDILVTATASMLPIIGKGMVEKALKLRKHKPMFMVDLAVPRDIEPEIGKLDDVFLYCLDDLQTIIENNLQSRRNRVFEAEQMIELHVSHFMRWLRLLNVVGTISQLRAKKMAIRDQELNKALQLLRQGKSPEIVMQRLAHTLTNKILHKPTVNLRHMSYDGQIEIIDAARRLFDLNEEF